MKTIVKITGAVLVLVVLCAVIVPFSASSSFTGIVGDADHDGKITILDATRVQRTLAGLYDDADGMTALLGDSNGNGLDILDATRIQRHLAGFTVDYPVGQPKEYEIDEPAEPTAGPGEPPVEPTAPQPTKKDPYELPLVD